MTKNHSKGPVKGKASKTTVAQTLDFLPSIKERPHYPDELKAATQPFVVVNETVTLDDGSKTTLPAVWGRLDLIVNRPDPLVPGVRRDTPEEWAVRMADYRAVGILQAVSVRPVKGGVKLEYGKHRVMGASELGWTYIRMDVDAKGTEATSAYKALQENAMRKEDLPYNKAQHYQSMMDPKGAALNQAQVAASDRVSQATVSRRLRLVHANFPAELGVLVGVRVDEKTLEPLFSVLDDKDLVVAGSKAVLAEIQKGTTLDSHAVLHLVANAWAQARPPLAITNRPDDVPHEVLADPEMRKAMATFKPFVVRVPSKWNDNVEECGFYRDVAAFRAKAQAVNDRLEAEAKAEEAKHLAKAVKEGKKVKDGKVVEAPRRRTLAERLPERVRRVQLDQMPRHLKAQVSFPETLVVEALARYVDKCGGLHSKADQAAALAALGVESESKLAQQMANPHYGMGIEPFYRDLAKAKDEGRPRDEDGFHALWKKDKTAALRCVAVAMFFDGNQGGSSVLGDDLHAKMLTGITEADAEALARQSIKDQDAGYKPVVDGAGCDHCDKPATLRRKGYNVCRSEFFGLITPNGAAARRMARAEAAKNGKTKGAEPVKVEVKAAPNGKANGAAKAEAKPAKNGKAHAKPTGKVSPVKGRPKAAAGA